MANKTVAELMAEIEALRTENATIKAETAKRGVSLRVTEKGCVGFYGMRRFPIVLFVEEAEKILDMANDVRAFITANEARLSRKSKKAQG